MIISFGSKILKQYTKLDEDIVFGTVYVPPAQSRFLNEDEFGTFETEITSMCSSHDFVYISEDINARTAELCDFTSLDEFLSEYFDFDQETMQFYDQRASLDSMGIQLDRKSKDKLTSNNGRNLQKLYLTILNGGYGKDKDIGNMTIRNISDFLPQRLFPPVRI